MISDLLKRVSKLEESMGRLVQLAIVLEVDAEQALVKCEIQDDNKTQTPALPWLVRAASDTIEWWAPKPGEQVIVIGLTGSQGNAVVLPSLYSTQHPAPETDPNIRKLITTDGASITHDMTAKTIAIETQGDVSVTSTGKVSVEGSEVLLNNGDAGGVVCQTHLCAFTGAAHPQGSAKVKAGA